MAWLNGRIVSKDEIAHAKDGFASNSMFRFGQKIKLWLYSLVPPIKPPVPVEGMVVGINTRAEFGGMLVSYNLAFPIADGEFYMVLDNVSQHFTLAEMDEPPYPPHMWPLEIYYKEGGEEPPEAAVPKPRPNHLRVVSANDEQT